MKFNQSTILVLLSTLLLVQGFIPPTMRVSSHKNSQRASMKSVGLLSSMQDNINGTPNPTQIMVSNLPFDATTEELEAFASQAGQVVNAKIILDRETGRSKGYGFVLFTEALSATYALEKLDGMELGGRPLKIRPAMRKSGGGGGQRRSWSNEGGDQY